MRIRERLEFKPFANSFDRSFVTSAIDIDLDRFIRVEEEKEKERTHLYRMGQKFLND